MACHAAAPPQCFGFAGALPGSAGDRPRLDRKWRPGAGAHPRARLAVRRQRRWLSRRRNKYALILVEVWLFVGEY